MASKLSGWVDEAVGAALIVAGVCPVWYCPPLAPYVISAGVGLMMTGVGTLISSMGGLTGVHTLSRNPDQAVGRDLWPRPRRRNEPLHEGVGQQQQVPRYRRGARLPSLSRMSTACPVQRAHGADRHYRRPQRRSCEHIPCDQRRDQLLAVQESHTCSVIIRANNVVTVTTQDIPLLMSQRIRADERGDRRPDAQRGVRRVLDPRPVWRQYHIPVHLRRPADHDQRKPGNHHDDVGGLRSPRICRDR